MHKSLFNWVDILKCRDYPCTKFDWAMSLDRFQMILLFLMR